MTAQEAGRQAAVSQVRNRAPQSKFKPAAKSLAKLKDSLQRITDNLALRHIYLPHYQSKNVRWGFIGRGKRVRQGLKKAENRLTGLLNKLEARGKLTREQRDKFSASLTQRLDEHFAKTTGKDFWEKVPLSQSKRFPDGLPLKAGSKSWWRWLKRATKLTVTPYSKINLLIDGPQWRRANKRLIQQAKGFLHIASWGWHYDEQGTWFAHQLIATKLQMSPKKLERMLKRQSLEQIRDHRLALQLRKTKQIKMNEAKQQVAAMSEEQRRAMVTQLLNPLHVRILLGSLIQNTMMRREQFLKKGELAHVILEEMRKAGIEIALERKMVSRANLKLHPQNAWAMVPHAKMTISADEALTGGMNFGDHYLQPERKDLDWHDAAVRVKGELARDLNESFIARWNKLMESDGTPEGKISAPQHDSSTRQLRRTMQKLGGSAMVVGTDDWGKVKKTTYSYRTSLMMALAGVQERFDMVVPYLTSPLLVKQLIRTAQRLKAEGKDPAKIAVTITNSTDTLLTGKFITSHFVYKLQQAGITVRFWKPDPQKSAYLKDAIHHAKAWIADDKVAYIGSANGTVRSLVQDWEMGLLVDDPAFIAKLKGDLFQVDSQFLVPPKPRSVLQRAAGQSMALLLGPILRLL